MTDKNARLQTAGEAAVALILVGMAIWLASQGETLLAAVFGIGSATYVADILRRARKRQSA
ncbi:hypothetical protein ACFY5F_28365 [Streptomyces sp. NPDC013161]|uniref:hypothetical protein n=1 Tax=Streptomyces sp. NPDC013161 TaxID=3364862 RepID=UPI0036B2743E